MVIDSSDAKAHKAGDWIRHASKAKKGYDERDISVKMYKQGT